MLIVDDAAGRIGPIGYGASVVGAVDQQVQGAWSSTPPLLTMFALSEELSNK